MSSFLKDYLASRKPTNSNGAQRRNTGRRDKIDKSLLPEPRDFYAAYDIALKGSTGWQMVKCPFHSDTHASMGVNRGHGGFKCHACGASGDCIGFYMRYHSVSFIDACKALQLVKEA